MLSIRSHHDEATGELVVRVHGATDPDGEIEMRLPETASVEDVAAEFQAAAFGRTLLRGLEG